MTLCQQSLISRARPYLEMAESRMDSYAFDICWMKALTVALDI